MKPGYLLALLCMVPLLAQADIYKSVDADGHVTYSSAPLKGGKRVVVTPPNTRMAPERTRAVSTPQEFPRVSQETQRGRDVTRRNILQDELKTEEGLLNEARQDLAQGEKKQPKDAGKIAALTKQVDLHQRNINALKIELSKLK